MRNTDVHSTHLTKKKRKGREEAAEREWEGKNRKRKRLRRKKGKKEWEGGRKGKNGKKRELLRGHWFL